MKMTILGTPFVKVRTFEWMSLIATALSRVPTGWSFASQNVHSAGGGFKVVRLNAHLHSAQMINLQTLRYWADMNLVRIGVRVAENAINGNSSVSVGVRAPFPHPVFVSFFDLCPKSRQGVGTDIHSGRHVFNGIPWSV